MDESIRQMLISAVRNTQALRLNQLVRTVANVFQSQQAPLQASLVPGFHFQAQ